MRRWLNAMPVTDDLVVADSAVSTGAPRKYHRVDPELADLLERVARAEPRPNHFAGRPCGNEYSEER